MTDEEKKIIIDEDWKTEAQKEKEKLKEQESTEKGASAQASQEKGVALPPADFSGLVSILASQAFYALGVFRLDEKDEREPDFGMAKFNIDLLGILEEKCKGNLSDEESKMLKATLEQLRMAFVQLTK